MTKSKIVVATFDFLNRRFTCCCGRTIESNLDWSTAASGNPIALTSETAALIVKCVNCRRTHGIAKDTSGDIPEFSVRKLGRCKCSVSAPG